jgi:hypothetical protein
MDIDWTDLFGDQFYELIQNVASSDGTIIFPMTLLCYKSKIFFFMICFLEKTLTAHILYSSC